MVERPKFSNFYSFGKEYQEGTPIPMEVGKYYMKHGYGDRGIPLNADTAYEIWDILHGGDEDNDKLRKLWCAFA